jgi:hypothetical protein
MRAPHSLHPLRKTKSGVVRFLPTLAGKASDLQQTDSVQRIRNAAQFEFICNTVKYIMCAEPVGMRTSCLAGWHRTLLCCLIPPLLSVIYAQDIFGNPVA